MVGEEVESLKIISPITGPLPPNSSMPCFTFAPMFLTKFLLDVNCEKQSRLALVVGQNDRMKTQKTINWKTKKLYINMIIVEVETVYPYEETQYYFLEHQFFQFKF